VAQRCSADTELRRQRALARQPRAGCKSAHGQELEKDPVRLDGMVSTLDVSDADSEVDGLHGCRCHGLNTRFTWADVTGSSV
jgi:hypothetical protein